MSKTATPRGEEGQDGGGPAGLEWLETAMGRLDIRHPAVRRFQRWRERQAYLEANDPRLYDPFVRYYNEKERQRRLCEERGQFSLPLRAPGGDAPGSPHSAVSSVGGGGGVGAPAGQNSPRGTGGSPGGGGDDEPPTPDEAFRHAERYDLTEYQAALDARRARLRQQTRRPRGATDPRSLVRGSSSKELWLGVLKGARVYLAQEQGSVTWKGLRFLENVVKLELGDPGTKLEDDLHNYPDTPLEEDPDDAVYEPLRALCEDPRAWLSAYEEMADVVFTLWERELFIHLVSEYVGRFSQKLVQRALNLRGELSTKKKRYTTATGRTVWVEVDDDASDSEPFDDDDASFDDDDDDRRSLASAVDSDDSDSDDDGVDWVGQGGAETTVFDRVEARNLRRMQREELNNYVHSAPDDYSAWYRGEAERLREARLQHTRHVWARARRDLARQLAGRPNARDPALQAFATMDEPDSAAPGPAAQDAVLWSMLDAAEQDDMDTCTARLDGALFPPKPASATRGAIRRAQRAVGVIADDDVDPSVGVAEASIPELLAGWLSEELQSYYHDGPGDYSARYREKVATLERRWLEDHLDEFRSQRGDSEGTPSEEEVAAKARELQAEWARMTSDGSVELFPPKPAENTEQARLAHEMRESRARMNATVQAARARKAGEAAQMQKRLYREIRGHVRRLVQEGKSPAEVAAAMEALWRDKRLAPKKEAAARAAMIRSAAEALDRDFRMKQRRAERRELQRLSAERKRLYAALRLQHGLTGHRRRGAGAGAGAAVPLEQLLARARSVAAAGAAPPRRDPGKGLALSQDLERQIHDLEVKLQSTQSPPVRDRVEETFRDLRRAYGPRKRRLSDKTYSLLRDELDVRNMKTLKAHLDTFVVPGAWQDAVLLQGHSDTTASRTPSPALGSDAAGEPGATPEPICISLQDPPLFGVRRVASGADGGVGVGDAGDKGKRRARRGSGDGLSVYWRNVFSSDDAGAGGDGRVPAFVSDPGAGPSQPP